MKPKLNVYIIIIASFVNQNQMLFKKYKIFMNSKLPNRQVNEPKSYIYYD